MHDPESTPVRGLPPGLDRGPLPEVRTEWETYLDALESHLDLPQPFRSEAREEIAGHLTDATTTLQANGFGPAEAAQEAIRRMGSPAELGREMTRARQTRRALLAAVGPGIWAAGGGAFRGFVFGIALITTVVLAASLGLRGIQLAGLPAIDMSEVPIGHAQATLAMAIASWFAAWRGSRALVAVVSQRSRRRAEGLRRWIAAAGGLVILAFVAFWFRGAQDQLSVIALLAVPLAFAGGALTADGRAIEPRRRSRVVVTAGLVVLVALNVAMAGAPVQQTLSAVGAGPFGSMEELLRSENTDLPGRYVADPPDFGTVSDSVEDGVVIVSLGVPSTGGTPRWQDMRLEAWRALDLSSGPPTLDRRFDSPFAAAPLVEAGDRMEGSLRIDAARGVAHYWLVVTGLAADGRRDLLVRVTGGATRFVGTVWDWLTAP